MTLDLDAIGAALGSPVTRSTPLAGGDISGASRLRLQDGRRVVAKSGPSVEIEARMLRAIADTGAHSPDVLATGEQWFAMEWIEPDGSGDRWVALAKALALLHRPNSAHFGWDEDYSFGPVAIENTRSDNWATFWAQRRLLCHVPHIERALGKRIERLSKRVSDLLPSNPDAALLHGDLWGGNFVWSGKNAYLIDPACYYGHREVDWAMLTLFDHPPDSFFESFAPEPGWRERQPLYRLWPWLVHLRLFGGSYKAAVERELVAVGF